GRTKGEPVLLRRGDQFRDGLERRIRAADHHEGEGGQGGDRREVLVRVEGEVLVERAVDRLRADITHQQRVAVGGGSGDHFRADVAARAGAIFHYHGLSPLVAELLAHDA